jgi:F-type H+-transporting ATPase subunit delta
MSLAAVAERYARALFELGVEAGQLAQVTGEVRRVADLYRESPDLKYVLGNPVIPDDKREALIGDLSSRLGLSAAVQSALRLMAARHRLPALPDMSRELERLADEQAGVVRVTVTSAQPLSDAYCRELGIELEQVTRRKVVLERRQDPALLGGVITRIGDRIIDGSVRGRLDALARQLLA